MAIIRFGINTILISSIVLVLIHTDLFALVRTYIIGAYALIAGKILPLVSNDIFIYESAILGGGVDLKRGFDAIYSMLKMKDFVFFNAITDYEYFFYS